MSALLQVCLKQCLKQEAKNQRIKQNVGVELGVWMLQTESMYAWERQLLSFYYELEVCYLGTVDVKGSHVPSSRREHTHWEEMNKIYNKALQ